MKLKLYTKKVLKIYLLKNTLTVVTEKDDTF